MLARKLTRDDEPPAVVDLGSLERPRKQLQLRELHRLVDPLEDAMDICARFHELGRQSQRSRCRVRVLKPPGVGDDGDVESLGDLRRQLDA